MVKKKFNLNSLVSGWIRHSKYDLTSHSKFITPPIEDLLGCQIDPDQVEKRSYLTYVEECCQNLIQFGTARYTKVEEPFLVTYLDVRTKCCPNDPPINRPYWRGFNRDAFWQPRGSDWFTDQTTIEVLYLLSQITQNSNFKEFADKYIKAASAIVDPHGMFWWGWHRYYNVFTGKCEAPDKNYHEIHIYRPRWESIYKINPKAVEKEIQLIAERHIIDPILGIHNRHDKRDAKTGSDFSMSAGEFIFAFCFLYSKNHEEQYLNLAKNIAMHHWNARNIITGLIPNIQLHPECFDAQHFDTSVPGIFCYYLLKSYEITNESIFLNHALGYLRAYAKYGYDPNVNKFWGALLLDGTPAPAISPERITSEWPNGYVDLWQPYHLGYEYPLHSAQTYVYAYQITNEKIFLEIAEHWAKWILSEPPETGCKPNVTQPDYDKYCAKKGTYAEHYGRTISFFIHLFALTKKQEYFESARVFAQDAVSKLYYQGLFRGHPTKPYYGSIDGVGILMYSLIQIDMIQKYGKDIIINEFLGGDKIPGLIINYDNF